MLKLVKNNSSFYLFFLPVYIGSSYVTSAAPLFIGAAGLLWFIFKGRYDYMIFTFFLTLIIANNKAPVYSSFEMLRFLFLGAMVVMSFLVLLKKDYMDRRVYYFLPFFITAIISSYLFSPNAFDSIIKVVSYLLLVISIFVFVKYVLKDTGFYLYEHVLLLIFVTMVLSLVGRYIDPSSYMIAGRLNGVMGNPNFLALYCVLVFPLIDHFKAEESFFTERELNILKGLIVLCLFLTGSRNGYASFIIYLMGTIFLFRGFSGKTVAILLGLGGLLAFTQVQALTEFLPFMQDFLRPETIQSASGRSIVWAVAVDEIMRQPWLGGGFEYYSYYMPGFADAHGLEGVFWYGVWNSYLAFLMDTGVIGLMAYFFFIYGVIKNSTRLLFILPYLGTVIFTAIFEAWAVSSLNPITPVFLLFFIVISERGSRYEYFSLT